MMIINKKHILAIAFVLISLVTGCKEDYAYKNFIKQIVTSDVKNIDSIFNANPKITNQYVATKLRDIRPSEYFGNSFEDFSVNFKFVGNKSGFIPKEYHEYRLENDSNIYIDFLVVNEKSQKMVRFIFLKKKETAILYNIEFE